MSLATSRLTIDLAALVTNWRKLAAVSPHGTTGAAVKADAYGLGAGPVVEALYEAGCRDFFVAQAVEGVSIRGVAGDARIFVLGGLGGAVPGDFVAAKLIPVINRQNDLDHWKDVFEQPFALHFDTGMNRLGFDAKDATSLAQSCQGSGLCLVMSHLACADEPLHEMNARQLAAFQAVATHFPGLRKSFANSGGIFCGPDYHFDLTRPGIALYGGAPVSGTANPMQSVACFEAKILQIRNARKGESVGYSATQVLTCDSRIAIVGAGYADGILRGASHKAGGGGFGFLAGQMVPILGRVSMDLTALDVSDVPQQVLDDAIWAEFFGHNIALDEFGQAAGTISYEVLTGIGRRAERVWV